MLKLFVKTQHLIQLIKDESGQDLVEYSLLGALIAVVCIGAMSGLAGAIQTEFNAITTAL